jgi:hypothetical protein
MARTTATNFSGGLQFPYATAATDVFKKEDLQTLAQAVDQHDHTAGKGVSVAPANASVTNAKLASDTARANLLTNGGMEQWQRGSGPFSTGAYSADRWLVLVGGTNSVSRDTANAERGACAAVTTTGTGNMLYQPFVSNTEGLELRGRILSLSVRVKCSVANACRVSLFDNPTTVFSAYHSGGGAYETLTVSLASPISAASVNAQVRIWFDAAGTFYIDNAMLVVGSVPADYAPLHPADDLARCLRYYEILGESQTSVALSAYATAGGVIQYSLGFKARKAVTPTVTKNGTWTVSNCSQPSAGTGLDALYIQANVTALGMAQFYNGSAGNTITLESNP